MVVVKQVTHSIWYILKKMINNTGCDTFCRPYEHLLIRNTTNFICFTCITVLSLTTSHTCEVRMKTILSTRVGIVPFLCRRVRCYHLHTTYTETYHYILYVRYVFLCNRVAHFWDPMCTVPFLVNCLPLHIIKTKQ